jgi:hypothetical protein
MKLLISLPHSQEPATCSFPEPGETSPFHIMFLYDRLWSTMLHKAEDLLTS